MSRIGLFSLCALTALVALAPTAGARTFTWSGSFVKDCAPWTQEHPYPTCRAQATLPPMPGYHSRPTRPTNLRVVVKTRQKICSDTYVTFQLTPASQQSRPGSDAVRVEVRHEFADGTFTGGDSSYWVLPDERYEIRVGATPDTTGQSYVCSYQSARAAFAIDVTVSYRLPGGAEPQRVLSAASSSPAHGTDSTSVGDRLLYRGFDWDPHGGRIDVLWRGHRIERFPAASSFSGQVRVEHWRDRRPCSATLEARQGRTTKRILVRGTALARFDFVNGVSLDGRALRRGDLLCAGESPTDLRTGAFVLRALRPDLMASPFYGLFVGQTGGAGFTSAVGYVYARTVKLTISGQVQDVVTDGPTVRLSDYYPQGEDVNTVPKVMSSPTLQGFNYSPESVFVTGDLQLSDARLFVKGDLLVGGTIRGMGAVIATGSIQTNNGVSSLRTDSSGPGTVAIAAGGSVTLGPK